MACARAECQPVVLLAAASREEGKLARMVFEGLWPEARLRTADHAAVLADFLAGGEWHAAVVDGAAKWAGGSRLAGVLERLRPGGVVVLVGEDEGGTAGGRAGLPRDAATLLKLPEIVRGRLEAASEREAARESAEEEARVRAGLEQTVERLRRERAELEHLASFASHELQEPLRTVERYTRLLAEKPAANGAVRQYADLVLEGTGRMHALVEDMLRYSRAMRAEPKIETVDANRMLAGALAGLHASIAESGAEIRRGELPEIGADAGQLTTVFQNLVANAIKYRGARPLRIDIGAERQAGGWRFYVRDNGMGIAPKDQERIFQPFERLHSKDEIPGTGLGLALCRRIVERHGGELKVESQPGEGSTFSFVLPAMETCHALS